ncbi:MAG TPA: hypothetical protein VIL11_03875 [Limnochordales bacterium]
MSGDFSGRHGGQGLPGERRVLAVDPGREKSGLAVVDGTGRVHFQGVVHGEQELMARAEELARRFGVQELVVGESPWGRRLARQLEAESWVQRLGGVRWVAERGSTWAGRRLYWRQNPPRGLWRWVPTGLRVPPRPWDDCVAVVLAWRYLGLPETGT